MDDNQNGELSRDEFANGIRECGLELTQEQMAELFQNFDRDGSGAVKYDEFLRSIRVSFSKVF